MLILRRNLAIRGVAVENAKPSDGFENGKPTDEELTIDLRVGDSYQIPGEWAWNRCPRKLVVHPGRCLLVKTCERITTPASLFGMLFSKGSLGARGLVVGNTKVDPLFDDFLSVPVFNVGKRNVILEQGMPFCSIAFVQTEQPIRMRRARQAFSIPQVRRSRLVMFFEAHAAQVWVIVLSVLLSIGATIATMIVAGLGGKPGT
jgi:dUTPase